MYIEVSWDGNLFVGSSPCLSTSGAACTPSIKLSALSRLEYFYNQISFTKIAEWLPQQRYALWNLQRNTDQSLRPRSEALVPAVIHPKACWFIRKINKCPSRRFQCDHHYDNLWALTDGEHEVIVHEVSADVDLVTGAGSGGEFLLRVRHHRVHSSWRWRNSRAKVSREGVMVDFAPLTRNRNLMGRHFEKLNEHIIEGQNWIGVNGKRFSNQCSGCLSNYGRFALPDAPKRFTHILIEYLQGH